MGINKREQHNYRIGVLFRTTTTNSFMVELFESILMGILRSLALFVGDKKQSFVEFEIEKDNKFWNCIDSNDIDWKGGNKKLRKITKHYEN